MSSHRARQKGKRTLLTLVLAATLVPSFPPLPNRVVLPPRRRRKQQVWTRTAWTRCSRAVERLAGATWNLRIRGHFSATGESVGGGGRLSGMYGRPTDLSTAVRALVLCVDLIVGRATMTTRSGSRRSIVVALAAAAAAADDEDVGGLLPPPRGHLRPSSSPQRRREREEEKRRR